MPRDKKTPRLICPVCWKARCSFFHRIHGARYSDDEKTTLIVQYHRDVCPNCKKLRCTTARGPCKERRMPKSAELPEWFRPPRAAAS